MKIGIIGAGLSGLVCALRLEQQGFDGSIDIFEKKPAVGSANVFMEFISEMFHRPIPDFFGYLANEYQIYLKPLHTVQKFQLFGPTESVINHGYIGHSIVRGNHPDALEKQLAQQIKSPIYCGEKVDLNQLKSKYDVIVLATGRLQDVPAEVGVRVDRYVSFYHGILQGDFDPTLTKVWFDDRYSLKGYSFMIPISESEAFVSLATPVPEFNLQEAWDKFNEDILGEAVVQGVHEIRNFAIGCPNKYTYKNIIFAGNVAGAVQPAMGFGLHVALLSGINAADSILTGKSYEKMMDNHSKEYLWSLALRNALEGLNPSLYDLMVKGANSYFGRAIIRKGGLNINRYGGKLLSLLTNETKKSIFTNHPAPYYGILHNQNESYEQQKDS